MPKTPRIYIDIDDVLCETAREFLPVVKTLFGRDFTFEDIRYFDLGRTFGLNSDQLNRLMEHMHRTAMLEQFRVLPDAPAILAGWRARGIGVDIVTGRPPETREVTERWLHANELLYDELIFVDKYGRNTADQANCPSLSLQELLLRDYATVIEDSPQTLDFLIKRTPWHIIIFDRPWNRDVLVAAGQRHRISRCGEWSAISQAIAI